MQRFGILASIFCCSVTRTAELRLAMSHRAHSYPIFPTKTLGIPSNDVFGKHTRFKSRAASTLRSMPSRRLGGLRFGAEAGATDVHSGHRSDRVGRCERSALRYHETVLHAERLATEEKLTEPNWPPKERRPTKVPRMGGFTVRLTSDEFSAHDQPSKGKQSGY